MSISNRHTVNPFIAGKSEPLTDQRLIKVGYKTTAKNPAKYPSICVSVPQVSDPISQDYLIRLMPYIRAMVESAQDGIVKSLYESSQGKLSEVSDDDICVDACIAYLESESTGGRLTKEYLESWFDSQMSDNLTVAIATKLGFTDFTDAQAVQVKKHVNAYRGLVSSLAGGKTILTEQQIKGLNSAMDVVSIEDDTASKLRARLTAMTNKPKVEELLEL